MSGPTPAVAPSLEPASPASAVAARLPWYRQRLWRTLRRGSGPFNVGFLVLVIFAAVTAPWITSRDPILSDPVNRLRPPGWKEAGAPTNLLGTDQLGRDVYTRLVYGARISLVVGLCTVLISAVVGSTMGLVAGYFEGRLGTGLMRLADIQLAFPFLLLALAVVATVGAGLLNVILILGIAGWAAFARVVRSQVLSIKQREFVEAVRAIGARQPAVVVRHVVPNVLTSVIVLGTATVANNIVVEASLTFLGLGVQPTIPSWGSMLADARGLPGGGVVDGHLPGAGPDADRARHQPAGRLAPRLPRPHPAQRLTEVVAPRAGRFAMPAVAASPTLDRVLARDERPTSSERACRRPTW